MHFIVVIKAERIGMWKCEETRQNFVPCIIEFFFREFLTNTSFCKRAIYAIAFIYNHRYTIIDLFYVRYFV